MSLLRSWRSRRQASIWPVAGHPGQEGVSTDRLFQFLTTGPMEVRTASETESIVDNLDPNEDAQLFHDWVMSEAIGWVSDPTINAHWKRFPGIKLNEIDWHALSDKLRAHHGWPLLRAQPEQKPEGDQPGDERRAYWRQHPEDRKEEFKRLEDEARDIGSTVREMREEDEGLIEKTSAASDPFRQAILDWVEFKRRDEPKTNVFKITAHSLFNSIKGADLSSWGPFARAIDDLVKDGVIAKTSQGTDWILWHDRRKHRGGHTMVETQPKLVDPKKFDQEAGRLISFIANELRENGPSDSARLSNLAHQSSKWPYDDNFSRVYTYALEYLENKGEIKFDDQTNSWTIVPVAKTYDSPSDVPEMAGAQREEMINRLLDKWRAEPEARPQIEQQLKSLRALRQLLMLRRAAIDTPGGHRVILNDDIVVWGRASLAQDERLPHIMLAKGTSVWVVRKFKLNKFKKSSPDLLEIKWIDESGGGLSGEYGHGVVRADDFRHFTGVSIVDQMGVEVDDSETWSPFDEPKKKEPETPGAPETPADVPQMNGVQRDQAINKLIERWRAEPEARPQIEQQMKSLGALSALFRVRRAAKDELWAPDPEIVKNTWRRYQCTVCGNVQAETTNHLGAIMSYCKKCSWAPSKGECYNPMGDGRCYRKFTYLGEIDERHQSKDDSVWWDTNGEAWNRRGEKKREPDPEGSEIKHSASDVIFAAGFSDPQQLVNDLQIAFTKSGAREHRDHHLVSIHLTGSRWYGREREDSDLDVICFHNGQTLVSEATQAFRARVAEITGGRVDALLMPHDEPWGHPMSGNIMGLTAGSTSNFFRAGERQSADCSCGHDEKTHQIGGLGPVVECQNFACNCRKFAPVVGAPPNVRQVKDMILNLLQSGPRTMAGVQDVLYTKGVPFASSHAALGELMKSNLIRKDDTARVHLQRDENGAPPPVPGSQAVDQVMNRVPFVDAEQERDRLLDQFNKGEITREQLDRKIKMLSARLRMRLLLAARPMKNLGPALDKAQNMFGPLSPEIRKRILNFLQSPSTETWDDIQSIIISGFGTIWQGMLEVDPSFPRSGRQTDQEGNVIRDWERIPTPEQVLLVLEKNTGGERQSLLSSWIERRAEGADPAAGPFKAPWPDQIQAFMQAVYDQTVGHPFTRGQRVWDGKVIVEVAPWRGGPDPDYPWIISLKWLQSMEPGEGNARRCMEWLTALADQFGVFLDLHAKPTGEPRIPKKDLKNFYKDQGFERDRGQGPDDMMRNPISAAWRARRAAAETQIGTIVYRGQEVPVVMPTADLDQWLKLRTDDRIIHDQALGEQFTALVAKLYDYAALKIEPNANIRESQNISLYPDIERALDYFGYGRDEANHKLQEPGGEDKLKTAAFSMFEQYRLDQMNPKQAADMLMNMAVVLHKDMGMTMDEAKARLSSLLIEWGGGGPENLHLNSLTMKWRERRAVHEARHSWVLNECTRCKQPYSPENNAKPCPVGMEVCAQCGDPLSMADEEEYCRDCDPTNATLRGRWTQRRAGNDEQKLLRELVCTVIGSDSGTTNEAVLPAGAVVGVQPWSNDHTIFFYSPIYSKIIVRGKVMKSNQYSAPVQDFRAATDIGYGEGTGYKHGPECFCDECMANDDMSTHRCPTCGSRECPGDGHSIDCRKPGTMTIKDVPTETKDSLLDKFNRGEIDEATLRRRMKQISQSMLSRWHRRAESQAALIREVLGQITEDEIAHSGIANRATDFVWTRTTIDPKTTNWGRDAIGETQSWLKQEEDDYLSDMGEPRVRGGDEAKRQALASEPVVVIKGDDGVLWVLDGNHRTAQAVIWGIESLPALLGVKKPGVGRTPVDPNYKMGSMFERWVMRLANDPLKKIIEINGVKVGIEWPKGSTRTWKHLPGNDYEKLMKADYGYIRQTEGEDGEEIDVYAGPDRDSDLAFVVTQLDKKTGEYDEDKIMLGYGSEAEAKASYLEHMEKAHFGGIKKMSWDEFLKLVPKSQRAKEKTAAMVDDPGSQMVLTDDLRIWDRASKGQGDKVESLVLPKGTTVKILKKFRLDHGGSPELLKITFWPPKGKAGAGLPTRGSGVVRADDLRFVVSGGVVGQVPEQSIPSNPKMIENHIVDLLRSGPSTISRDLHELLDGKTLSVNESGEVDSWDQPFSDMVTQVIGQMLDRGVIMFDGGTAEFSLLKEPEPTAVEHVPSMSQGDVQSKIDALLDQLAVEQDPKKKQQIEQRIRSLSAATKEVWRRRAGDTMSIPEQRSPGAISECEHEWPGKKPGERGWCGRCRL